jgi:hypothetical protein
MTRTQCRHGPFWISREIQAMANRDTWSLFTGLLEGVKKVIKSEAASLSASQLIAQTLNPNHRTLKQKLAFKPTFIFIIYHHGLV